VVMQCTCIYATFCCRCQSPYSTQATAAASRLSPQSGLYVNHRLTSLNQNRKHSFLCHRVFAPLLVPVSAGSRSRPRIEVTSAGTWSPQWPSNACLELTARTTWHRPERDAAAVLILMWFNLSATIIIQSCTTSHHVTSNPRLRDPSRPSSSRPI